MMSIFIFRAAAADRNQRRSALVLPFRRPGDGSFIKTPKPARPGLY